MWSLLRASHIEPQCPRAAVPRVAVPPSRRALRPVRGGTHDEGTPVSCGGMLSQEGLLVLTHCGEVRELQRPPLCAGECLLGEEDGSRRREGMEVSPPHVEAARQDLAARRATHRDPRGTRGWEGGGKDGRARLGGYGGVEPQGRPAGGGVGWGALGPPPRPVYRCSCFSFSGAKETLLCQDRPGCGRGNGYLETATAFGGAAAMGLQPKCSRIIYDYTHSLSLCSGIIFNTNSERVPTMRNTDR